MPFPFYTHLSPRGKSIYRRSDEIQSVSLPHAQLLHPLVGALREALADQAGGALVEERLLGAVDDLDLAVLRSAAARGPGLATSAPEIAEKYMAKDVPVPNVSDAELAERLGRELPAGAVVALDGDLGAGKTTFVRGLVRGLGQMTMLVAPDRFTDGEPVTTSTPSGAPVHAVRKTASAVSRAVARALLFLVIVPVTSTS